MSAAIAQALVHLEIEPVFVVAKHQLRRLPAEFQATTVVAPNDEHYVHFDSELADIVRRVKPEHVHSFGPLIDPRWSHRFSVTWHDAMRLQVKALVYSDEEIVLRTSSDELHRLQVFGNWCEGQFGIISTADSLHGKALEWYAWLARERAVFVATVSQTSRYEVQQAMGLLEPPIVVPPLLRPLTATEGCPTWITELKPYFLFVGTPEEHKRLDLVCRALFTCPEFDKMQVVVVGDMGRVARGISAPGSHRIRT